MTEKQLDTKETPIEELQCRKKYVYDTGIIFECKNNCKSEIIGENVVDLLNELNTENTRIKQTIQETYETERTALGKSVLKQLLETIGE